MVHYCIETSVRDGETLVQVWVRAGATDHRRIWAMQILYRSEPSIYPVQFTHRRRIHTIGIVSRDFHDKSHEIRCIIQLTQ